VPGFQLREAQRAQVNHAVLFLQRGPSTSSIGRDVRSCGSSETDPASRSRWQCRINYENDTSRAQPDGLWIPRPRITFAIAQSWSTRLG